LPRSLNPKILEMHGQGGRLLALQLPIGGQAGQSRAGLGMLGELFGGLLPTQLLRGCQLAQLQHVPLHNPAARTPAVLAQAPVRVDFAIFAPLMTS
jgi:hypothetical protein